jgi:DNA primase
MSQKLLNLLTRVINSQPTKTGQNNEYMFWSPFVSHHKPKLQINIQTQKWHCWVSESGGHNLFQLFKKVKASQKHFDELREISGDVYYTKYEKTDEVKALSLPEEFIPLWNGAERSPEYKNAIRYLKNRNITKKEILKYGIGYCEEGLYRYRIIIPSYDKDTTLNYFVGRDYYGGGMKYKNPRVSKDVVGFESMIDWNQSVILCEGVFDAIAIKRNAIPLFGKTLPPKLLKRLVEHKTKKLYLILDSDAQRDSIKIVEKLKSYQIDVNMISLEDKDPSELGFEKTIDIIKQTKDSLSFFDYVKIKLGS